MNLLVQWLCIVVETRAKQGGFPEVVQRWGEPDTSRSVLAASINDREFHPVCSKLLPVFDFIARTYFNE